MTFSYIIVGLEEIDLLVKDNRITFWCNILINCDYVTYGYVIGFV